MKISQLVEELERIKREHGDVEITKLDGSPLEQIVIDGPGNKVIEVVPL